MKDSALAVVYLQKAPELTCIASIGKVGLLVEALRYSQLSGLVQAGLTVGRVWGSFEDEYPQENFYSSKRCLTKKILV